MALTLAEAHAVVATDALSSENAFEVLAAVGAQGAFADRNVARDLLIRVLSKRSGVPEDLQPLLDGLVREHGLYPYMTDLLELSLADRLAYEAHRPDGVLGENLVFHSEQALVYERLLAGENVVLSAPTSFGKSLVIDAFLDASDFTNAVIVVPTIALMDESRRRLSRLSQFKIITHGSQTFGNRNLIIMTQERLLELGSLPEIDFFAIDEFYKLDPAHSDDRSSQLNIVLQRLLKTGAQFYLLGPNITGLEDVSAHKLRATFVGTGFTTVATDVERVNVNDSDLPDELAQVCRDVGGATMVFCRSPKRLRDVAEWLLERGVGGGQNLDSAADWIGANYHEDWIVARALRAGIGIHHGRLPRALGHHIVRLFNEGRLDYLLVTSTLIEGVNTTARNVIVLDHTIANKKYDYFTFSNIRGRSGRMFQHFVGRVIVFNPEPRPADLNVDIPILSQSPQTSDEVLLQIPDEELSPSSRKRIAKYSDQDLVSIETLRENRGISPQRQLDVARTISEDPNRWAPLFRWSGPFPTTEQIKGLGELLFQITGNGDSVKTAKQLAARVNMLRYRRGDFASLVRDDVKRGKDVDDAMDDALNFARNWAQFKIPNAFLVAGALADEVLSGNGASVSDPSVFAGQLENMFMPPFATVLEEYGVPTPTTLKLGAQLRLNSAESVDDVLARLRALEVNSRHLDPFEQEMLEDTQRAL